MDAKYIKCNQLILTLTQTFVIAITNSSSNPPQSTLYTNNNS